MQKCMPKTFSWGPVRGKSTARGRHFFPCHPVLLLSGIHFWKYWRCNKGICGKFGWGESYLL